eukprot:3981513-Alexandrium_andersonii.AAC.1
MTWKLLQLPVARDRSPTLAERGLGEARRDGDGGSHRRPMRERWLTEEFDVTVHDPFEALGLR